MVILYIGHILFPCGDYAYYRLLTLSIQSIISLKTAFTTKLKSKTYISQIPLLFFQSVFIYILQFLCLLFYIISSNRLAFHLLQILANHAKRFIVGSRFDFNLHFPNN